MNRKRCPGARTLPMHAHRYLYSVLMCLWVDVFHVRFHTHSHLLAVLRAARAQLNSAYNARPRLHGLWWPWPPRCNARTHAHRLNGFLTSTRLILDETLLLEAGAVALGVRPCAPTHNFRASCVCGCVILKCCWTCAPVGCARAVHFARNDRRRRRRREDDKCARHTMRISRATPNGRRKQVASAEAR